MHVEVTAKYNESIERLINRFNKKLKKSNIMQELRDRRYYKKPSEKRKIKKEKRLRTLRKLTNQNTS
jgi:small subunit ribosomal protein S21